MTTLAAPPPPSPVAEPAAKPRHETFADWWESAGRVPLDRVVFTPAPGTVTLEQYEAIDGRVNGRPVELVNSTLVEKAVARYESELAAVVSGLLFIYKRETKARGKLSGEQGMIRMTGANVRMPDVCWTAHEDVRDPDREQAAPLEPPTLAVEVVSESNTAAEIRLKLEEFFASGCRLAWVLYPKTKTVRVHANPRSIDSFTQLGPDDTLTGGEVLPGFEVKVSDLFDV